LSTPLRVLILEDNPSDAELTVRELSRAGFITDWKRVETEGDFLAALDTPLDLILADYSLPQFDGLRALALLLERKLDIPFIIVSGTIGEELAVEAIKKGAADYLIKDRLARLGQAVVNTLEKKRLRDINKREDEALRDSESVLRGFLEQSEDAIMLTDEQGLVIQWSKGAERLTGYSRGESLGKTLWDVQFRSVPDEYNSPDYYELNKSNLQAALLTGQATFLNHLVEAAIQRPDGSRAVTQTLAFPIHTHKGYLLGSILRDITGRKRREEQLAESETRYKGLFEDSPISLWEEDFSAVKQQLDALRADGVTDFQKYFISHPEVVTQCVALIKILDVNKATMSMFGADRKEDILKNSAKIFEGEPIQVFRDELINIAAGKISFGWEGINKTLDGRLIDVGLKWSAAPGHEDSLSRVIVSMIDITRRKQSEKRIRRQLEQLAALREIDRVIASSFDMHYNLTWILESVTKELGVDAADVLILNPVSSQLEYGGGVGFRNKVPEKSLARPAQSHAMRAVLDRQLVHIPNLKDQPNSLLSAKVPADEDFACYYGVPLIAKGSVKGVLEVFHRRLLEPDQDWLDFLNILAGQAALAIDNATLFNNLQRSNVDLILAYDATIEGWSRAMDLRDKETEGHTQRVTALVLELAGLFGIRDEKLVGIRRGALLHDIGKMGVPDGILLKPDKLTEEEWVIMKKHPALAFEMLSPIRYLQSAIDIPYCHHEKWDGSGYPRGLKGEQIPLAARIFSVIDVWDALTSDRPYRNAWPNEKVLEYLKSEAGTSFDPEVVKICLESGVFDRKGPN